MFEEDRVGEEMYFIYSGIIELQSKHCHNETVITIGDGCYFGDVAVLKGCKRTATSRCKTLCIMYSLSRTVLMRMLSDFEEMGLYMHNIAEGRKRRMDSLDPNSEETLNTLPLDMVHDREDAETELFRAEDALIARLLGITNRSKNTREVFGKALLTSKVVNHMGSEVQQSLSKKLKHGKDPWLAAMHAKVIAGGMTDIAEERRVSTEIRLTSGLREHPSPSAEVKRQIKAATKAALFTSKRRIFHQGKHASSKEMLKNPSSRSRPIPSPSNKSSSRQDSKINPAEAASS